MRVLAALFPRRLCLPYSFAGALLVAVAGAKACQICFGALVVTPGQQLDAAEQAVLAVPVAGETAYRIVEVVKGTVAGRTITGEVLGVDAAVSRSGAPLLLLRFGPAQRWKSFGAIGTENAGWLRQLAALGNVAPVRPKAIWPVTTTQTPSDTTEAQWRERLSLVVPYLEHRESLASEIAFGDISRAPYSAIRSLKSQLDAATIAKWIDDPTLAARRPTYTLLLGIAGGADDAALLERRLDAAWRSHDAANLAAMLAADLELRGPSRVDWIEQAYFADRSRTLPEIDAALLSLTVQGGANAAVPRERVIDAFRLFIRERAAMAGFVALQLADWEHWDATPDYVALLKSDAVKDPASHFAIVNYLRRSPHAAARASLELVADKPK